MGTTRNYRDVGQDFDAVRQGSNLKVDADTLSLPLASLFSGYFISWGVFELIFGNWYFRGWGVLRGIFKLSSFGNCDFFDLKREISKINIRWLNYSCIELFENIFLFSFVFVKILPCVTSIRIILYVTKCLTLNLQYNFVVYKLERIRRRIESKNL